MKQSKTLARSESQKETNPAQLQIAPAETGPLKVRRVDCLHDWVAIIQLQLATPIELTQESKYGHEGLVIGNGPGICAQLTGTPIPTQAKFGDVVAFQERSVADTMEPKSGPMAGCRIVIVKDANIICKVRRAVEYTEVRDEE